MTNGIPPSLDRIIYLRQVRAVLLLAILVGGTALFFSRDSFLPAQGFTQYQEAEPSGKSKAQAELASAYQAVQRAVVDQLGAQNLKEVEWLEPRHQGHHGWYSYDGQVRIKDWQENDVVLDYVVELQLGASEQWKVLSIDVRR